MEKIVKARKVYKCEICEGNIQKGEKHVHTKLKTPRYDDNDNQIGIEFTEFRWHNKNCEPKLTHCENPNEVLKYCNYGIHSTPVYDMDPDSCDDTEWCKWCGKIL